jgi:hypothetical protein
MEAKYSSVPEASDPVESIVIFSISILVGGFLMWYINKKIRESHETSDLCES